MADVGLKNHVKAAVIIVIEYLYRGTTFTHTYIVHVCVHVCHQNW